MRFRFTRRFARRAGFFFVNRPDFVRDRFRFAMAFPFATFLALAGLATRTLIPPGLSDDATFIHLITAAHNHETGRVERQDRQIPRPKVVLVFHEPAVSSFFSHIDRRQEMT